MAGEARRFELGAGFQLGSIRGIPIRIHVSFLLVLPLLAFGFARGIVEAARLAGIPAESLSGGPAIWGLLVALALFLSVLLHELAHSLYAIARGGKVRSITLLMIGGVSELEEAPRKPGQEAVMALVGPLTSLGLGAIFLALYLAARGLRSFDLSFALFQLAQMNLLLGAFNLLPAFPMDGGRILRSLLVKRRGPAQATAIAATVGKVFAILFGMAGFLTSNLLLVLVAFFVFMGAEGEQRGAAMEAALGGLRVADLMVPGVDAVSSVETASAVAARMVRDRRAWFPVVEGERALGVVTAEMVLAIPPGRSHAIRAGELAIPDTVVGPADGLALALRRLAARRVEHLAVAEAGRLCGAISRSDILRGVRLHELEASLRPPPASGT